MVNPARSRQKDAVAKRPDAARVLGLSFEGPRRKAVPARTRTTRTGLAAERAEVIRSGQ